MLDFHWQHEDRSHNYKIEWERVSQILFEHFNANKLVVLRIESSVFKATVMSRRWRSETLKSAIKQVD